MNSPPILLEGGLVVDGSGGPSWPGDVLLVDDRIARVGAGLRERLPEGLVVEELDVVDREIGGQARAQVHAQTLDAVPDQ